MYVCIYIYIYIHICMEISMLYMSDTVLRGRFFFTDIQDFDPRQSLARAARIPKRKGFFLIIVIIIISSSSCYHY